MNRGPLPGTGAATDYVAKATAAYAGKVPDWVLALAIEANRTSAAVAAKRIGYSQPVLSTIISGTYRGSLRRVEEVVRGALMGVVVMCPVLGEIGRDSCLHEQGQPFRATSAMRARLYHACKTCRHAGTAPSPELGDTE